MVVQMIMMMDKENWRTTRNFLKKTPFEKARDMPFRTSAGWKAERNIAG
jgi:hypothetical protein